MATDHVWKLVAPWYRWKQQGGSVRETRPVFQKYDSGDLVNAFLKDPQRSLKFLDEDCVTRLEPAGTVPSGPLAGKKKIFAEKKAVPGTLRKLFLDTHKRFYLVVCELHCDEPGFPSARRDRACEAGFVVRRRRTIAADRLTAEKARLEHDGRVASEKLVKLVEIERATKGLKPSAHSEIQKAKAALAERIRAADAARKAIAAGTRVLEGWVPSEFDRIGAWKIVSEEPQAITETIHPLHALFADPREPDHAGQGRTIYFGVVPTGAADTEDDGTPRLDELSEYEVRCFVRQHDERCPKKPTRGDCPGPIVWSRATEAYRIASHFDLVGTSNRPVTMQLPSIGDLRAQAASLPASKLAPFRMASPDAESNLAIKVNTSTQKAERDPSPPGIPEICSFSIPLITIVATFVFKLFLPIVMFLFQLWFLLKLKFCFPPSFSVSGGAKAALDVVPPEIDADVDLSVKLGATATANLQAALQADGIFEADVTVGTNRALRADLDAKIDPDPAVLDLAEYSNEALLSLATDMTADLTTGQNAASLTATLQFEARAPRSDGVVT